MGISGLGAGLKFIFDEGLDKIITHEKFLSEKLVAGLLFYTRGNASSA